MTRLPISVFIIAKNEADRISRAILGVRDWVDEVIVIDSGSTDDTVAISASLGARTIFNAWTGYGPQKVFGENQCRNKWLLNLDADEEITPEGAAEIQALFANGEPETKVFDIRFLELRPYETRPRRFPLVKLYTRLYHKDFGGFRPSPVHDSVVAKDGVRIGKLKQGAWHRSLRSHAHTLAKINSYTSMQAEDNFRKGRNFGPLIVIFTPLLSFLRAYFLRGYMFYGVEGVADAQIYAFSRALRVAKTRERFRMAEKPTEKPRT
jgi:glycosyltransferase involved in cell wall biosynthesis